MGKIKVTILRFVVGVLVLSLFAFTLTPRLLTIWKLSEQKADLEQRKLEADQINQGLVLQKEQLDNPQEMERIAREKLGMVKRGEKILVEVRTDSP